MNLAQLMGRLVKDPEIRYNDKGKCVAQFVLAVNRGYSQEKLKEGGSNTDFIPCVAFDKIAERIGNTVSKGQRLLVNRGTIRINNYTDKQGISRYHTEVHVYEYEYIEPKSSHDYSPVDFEN